MTQELKDYRQMTQTTEEEALSIGLVQLTVWLSSRDIDWIEREYVRLTELNKKRVVKLVRTKGMYALFVNDLTNSSYSDVEESESNE